MKREEKIFFLMTLCAVGAFVAALCQSAHGYRLEWDSQEPKSETVFEIWRGTNATGPFTPWATVAETSVAMPTGEPMGFFIVRASNTTSHLVSDWSHTP